MSKLAQGYGAKKTNKYFAVILTIVLITVIVYMVFGQLMAPMQVDGESMLDTLKDGQLVFTQKIFYQLKYDDIVVFTRPNKEYMCIKRLMGMPGDTIKFSGGKLYRNGELVDDIHNTNGYYMTEFEQSADIKLNQNGEYLVAKDMYFFMGDNRANSLDSRSYGGISREHIIGKALFIK